MNTYKVTATFIDHEQKNERSLSILFTASSSEEAVKSGYRWAINRHEALFEDQELFHVRVRVYNILSIELNGYCGTFGGSVIFRWRRDHSEPLSLKEAVSQIDKGEFHICL
jgi:hypothetical protein